MHKKYDRKWHVLLCDIHKRDEANQILLKEYKKDKILKIESSLPEYSRQISFHVDGDSLSIENNLEDQESSIYVLQKVQVDDLSLNIFFDSGCGDLVSKKGAIDKLEEFGRASQEIPGPIPLFGVGNQQSESRHGIYKVKIPLYDGREAVMSGICLDQVTKAFPMYPLRGQVEEDIHKAYELDGNNPDRLPKLPDYVGGETHLMIGIKYLKYFPERIFQLPNGLTVYKSVFKNFDGSRGVVGGPHRLFAEIEKQHFGGHLSMGHYFSELVKLVRIGYEVSLDIP